MSYHYRVSIVGYGSKKSEVLRSNTFGMVLSCHNEEHTAEDALKKAEKGITYQKEAVIQTEDRLKKGECYPELIFELYKSKLEQIQIERCYYVLKAIDANELEKVDYIVKYPANEFDESISFDNWMERFGDQAKAMLEQKLIEEQARAESLAKARSNINTFSNMAEEVTFSFPAVSGVQAGRQYFCAQVPLKYFTRFFSLVDEDLPPELRFQRKVNEKHAQDIAEYILSNPNDYVLPSVTASVSSPMYFECAKIQGGANRVGVLRINCDAVIHLTDGQHRLRASKIVLDKCSRMADETISVVFFYDEGLKRSKQIFADINSNSKSVSAAINSLYDSRNPFNNFVLDVISEAEWQNLIDKENTSIGKKSYFLYSLTHVKKFIEALIGIKERAFNQNFESLNLDTAKRLIVTVLKSYLINELDNLASYPPLNVREYYVSGYAVYFESFALALNYLYKELISKVELVDEDIEKLISTTHDIRNLNVGLGDQLWVGRCRVANRMVKNSDSVKLTAAVMREKVNLPLCDSMKEVIQRHCL